MPENKLYEMTKKREPQTSEWDDDPLELELQQANTEWLKKQQPLSKERKAELREARKRIIRGL